MTDEAPPGLGRGRDQPLPPEADLDAALWPVHSRRTPDVVTAVSAAPRRRPAPATARPGKSARERIRRERAHRARRHRIRVTAVSTSAIVLIAAAVAVGLVVQHNGNTSVKAGPGYAGPYAPVTLNADNSVVMSQPGVNKPVLDVYEDFLCPACKAFEKANGGMIERLARLGQVKVVYHPFTVFGGRPEQASSIRAWAAAKCAPASLWVRYHNALYASQSAEATVGAFPASVLVQLGKNAGITSPGFAQCVQSQKYAVADPPVSDQIINSGVLSVPILKLNGQALSVDLTPSELRKQILSARHAEGHPGRQRHRVRGGGVGVV